MDVLAQDAYTCFCCDGCGGNVTSAGSYWIRFKNSSATLLALARNSSPRGVILQTFRPRPPSASQPVCRYPFSSMLCTMGEYAPRLGLTFNRARISKLP